MTELLKEENLMSLFCTFCGRKNIKSIFNNQNSLLEEPKNLRKQERKGENYGKLLLVGFIRAVSQVSWVDTAVLCCCHLGSQFRGNYF